MNGKDDERLTALEAKVEALKTAVDALLVLAGAEADPFAASFGKFLERANGVLR
jgi:hypothetical protein